MKYAVVAELAFVDVVRELSDRFVARHSSRLDPERLSEILGRKKTFNRTLNGIDARLRDHVRNLVSAHREQQTVESIQRRTPFCAIPQFRHSSTRPERCSMRSRTRRSGPGDIAPGMA
jgi:hypothetical protein